MALDNKVTLSVKGIDCVNCATKIENRKPILWLYRIYYMFKKYSLFLFLIFSCVSTIVSNPLLDSIVTERKSKFIAYWIKKIYDK